MIVGHTMKTDPAKENPQTQSVQTVVRTDAGSYVLAVLDTILGDAKTETERVIAHVRQSLEMEYATAPYFVAAASGLQWLQRHFSDDQIGWKAVLRSLGMNRQRISDLTVAARIYGYLAGRARSDPEIRRLPIKLEQCLALRCLDDDQQLCAWRKACDLAGLNVIRARHVAQARQVLGYKLNAKSRRAAHTKHPDGSAGERTLKQIHTHCQRACVALLGLSPGAPAEVLRTLDKELAAISRLASGDKKIRGAKRGKPIDPSTASEEQIPFPFAAARPVSGEKTA
jgi:hypothetical protein